MARKVKTRYPHDVNSPASKSKSNSMGLKALLKKQAGSQQGRQAPKVPQFEPHWQEASDGDEGSLDFFLEASKPQRPCYTNKCDEETCHDSLNGSISSFNSHNMATEENARTKQKRRNRFVQMRVDRDLVARLELQNQALEQEAGKKSLNKSLNSFLTGTRRRAWRESTKSSTVGRLAVVDHPSSPKVRPKVAPRRLLKSLSQITLPLDDDNNNKHAGLLHFSEPDLPSVDDLSMDLKKDEGGKPESVLEAPTLSITEESFEVGRGRSRRETTIRHTRRSRPSQARSLSPVPSNRSSTRRHRSPMRSSRVRRSPIALELVG